MVRTNRPYRNFNRQDLWLPAIVAEAWRKNNTRLTLMTVEAVYNKEIIVIFMLLVAFPEPRGRAGNLARGSYIHISCT